MKSRLLCLVVICLMSSNAFAQTAVEEQQAKPPSTKIGAFLAKKGRVVVKDFFKIGTVSGKSGTSAEISVMIIYEPTQEAQRIRGLRVEVKGGGRLQRENTSFLDYDESESFAKAVTFLSATSVTWLSAKREYSEAIFSTKDDFHLGFYQDGLNQTCFMESGTIGKATCYFDMTDLGALREIADRAVELMKQK